MTCRPAVERDERNSVTLKKLQGLTPIGQRDRRPGIDRREP